MGRREAFVVGRGRLTPPIKKAGSAIPPYSACFCRRRRRTVSDRGEFLFLAGEVGVDVLDGLVGGGLDLLLEALGLVLGQLGLLGGLVRVAAHVSRAWAPLVASLGGSISAEHGIGVAKRDDLTLYKSTVELELMWQVKKALDTKNLLNPAKVLPAPH